MKKMKIFAATAMIMMIGTAGYFGYTAYQQANMTDADRMMQANLEALTSKEGGNVSVETCLGLNDKSCETSSGGKSTGPLVDAEWEY